MCPESLVVTKQKKYASRNPVSRMLMANFSARVSAALAGMEFGSLLEVGSGEGLLLARICQGLTGKDVFSIDIDLESVVLARRNFDAVHASVADAHLLPFGDKRFDVVVCSEVLEHVRSPERVMQEIRRVARGCCILTVPNEPIWRILNMTRGSYLAQWGNTPGHINHWSSRAFRSLAGRYFDILDAMQVFPWTGVVCRVRPQGKP